MTTRFKQSAVIMTALFVAAQFIRPARVNLPTDVTRTIQASAETANGLAAVLDRSCRDCHSNGTVSAWYTHVAPASWLMAYGVNKARRIVNFSDWAGYSPDLQRTLLMASCEDVKSGKMPGAYTLLRPDTRLSAQDVETICTAARQAKGGLSQ